MTALYAISRNPRQLHQAGNDEAAYYVGLEPAMVQENGGDKLDEQGRPIPIPKTARHKKALGPGLALVPSPALLAPGKPDVENYVTLVENDDPELGGPVTVHIVKMVKRHRYRGAIKTIFPSNIFEEKVTLRHTGDFGGNADNMVYQWFLREEDGRKAGLPDPAAKPPEWILLKGNSYQLNLEGTGGRVLADNLVFTRYRHKNDPPAGDTWTKNTEWARDGQRAATLDKDHNVQHDPSTGLIITSLQGEWAGAANSPTPDHVYRPQLVMGWLKRVLDRINPYEARFDDFRHNGAPATYVSMIQEAGQSYEGPVALNPDKNVVENVGLIELYQTLLHRAEALSIDLTRPISSPGVNNALQYAATRIQDLYMLLGNEAYADATDPTIGYGSDTADPGSAAASVWAFKNQTASLIEEELALLRGISGSYGRPVYNRLFWNFTKGLGEVAYAMNYNLSDENLDGFVDENDARLRYPQGHGDAWGHYTVALSMHLDLLQNKNFQWQPRAEFYNLLDVVIPVDYMDERKFARAAAQRA
ncbi:MAG: hypothetical protein AAF492_17645, partial [Verrucomicrobiota bacterium]